MPSRRRVPYAHGIRRASSADRAVEAARRTEWRTRRRIGRRAGQRTEEGMRAYGGDDIGRLLHARRWRGRWLARRDALQPRATVVAAVTRRERAGRARARR